MNYYDLFPSSDDGWHLIAKDTFSDGSPVDTYRYRRCQRVYDLRPVPVEIQVSGKPIDFYDMVLSGPVLSKRLADCWQSIAPQDIQRIPATVEGDNNEWEVIVVLNSIDCIDHKRSKITSYFPLDHPDFPGKPRAVLYLILDPDCIGGHHIFRPKGWESMIVVSETIKNAMEAMGATGIEYWNVSVEGPPPPRLFGAVK